MAVKNGSSWSASGRSDCVPFGTDKGLPQPPPDPQNPQSAKATESEKRPAADCEADAEHQAEMKGQISATEKASPSGMIERSLQAQLGRQLRTIFADVAQEPVPDRFIKLLEELEAREKRR